MALGGIRRIAMRSALDHRSSSVSAERRELCALGANVWKMLIVSFDRGSHLLPKKPLALTLTEAGANELAELAQSGR
jgi:hypothetical protein